MRHMSITPLRAIERNGLRGFGFSITFDEIQSSGPLTPPSEPQMPAELAASCPATPDEAFLPPVQASSGPNSGAAR